MEGCSYRMECSLSMFDFYISPLLSRDTNTLCLSRVLTVDSRYACKWWTTNLHKNALVTGTHDLGFMISPWARKAWELEHDTRAYNTCITAAKTLGARFNEKVQGLRSWDTCVTKRYSFTDPSKDFLVIIVQRPSSSKSSLYVSLRWILT